MYVFFLGSDLSELECGEFVEKVYMYGVKIVCMICGGQGVILFVGD